MNKRIYLNLIIAFIFATGISKATAQPNTIDFRTFKKDTVDNPKLDSLFIINITKEDTDKVLINKAGESPHAINKGLCSFDADSEKLTVNVRSYLTKPTLTTLTFSVKNKPGIPPLVFSFQLPKSTNSSKTEPAVVITSEYEDALDILRFINGDANVKIQEILQRYFVIPADMPAKTFIQSLATSNGFFKGLDLSKTPDVKLTAAGAFAAKSAGLAGILSSFDVTNIADGLAQFMVERAKEELNIAFFEEFKKKMEDERYSDLRMLFPETYGSLKKIDQEIYQLNNYVQTLRESMHHDLTTILMHAQDVINQDKYHPFFEDNPALEIILRTGLVTAAGLQDNKHPGDIIVKISEDNFSDAIVSQNFKSFVQTLNLFSQSFRYKDTSRYWVSSYDIYQNILSNKSSFQIYLGLLYEKLKKNDIEFKNKTGAQAFSVKQAFEKWASVYPQKSDSIKTYIKDITMHTDEIMSMLKTIKSETHDTSKENDPDFDDYYRFFNASIDLIESAFNVEQLPDFKLKDKIEKIPSGTYISIARLGCNIALNVKSKEYGSAVINVATLLDTLFGNNSAIVSASIERVLSIPSFKSNSALIGAMDSALCDPKYDLSVFISRNFNSDPNKPSLDSLAKMIKGVHVQQVVSLLIKYGTFAANIVRAKSPDEVKSALESAALPVGSYRIKRQTNLNVSVNGFLGITGGVEFTDSTEFVCGAWGPIGPSLNFGNVFGKKNPASFSLFFPIIDIGALALFRLNDDSTALTEKVYLGQIFSPGVVLSVGLPNLPINISAAYQLSPLLRSVETGSLVLNDQLHGRLQLTLAVDIPFFNIYSSTNKDKSKMSLKKDKKTGQYSIKTSN